MHLRPSTRAGYDGKLRAHILPRLGAVSVERVDTPAIRRFVAELVADGVSPATILGVRAVLRMVLGTAVEAGALRVNPCTGIKVPRPARLEMQFLTADEVEQLADAITAPPPRPAGHGAGPNWRTHLPEYGLLVRFAAYTGLRAGEIGALRIGRVDLRRSTVEVAESATEINGVLTYGPTKNYQRRSVPLPPFLRDDLAGHLQSRAGDPDEFVFTAPEGGPMRHNNFYRRHFKPAVRQAALPGALRFHDLRHTYASFLIAQDAHPRALMERLGHSSIQVTLGTYGHLLPGIDERLTAGLDTLARAARQPPSAPQADSIGSRLGHAAEPPASSSDQQ